MKLKKIFFVMAVLPIVGTLVNACCEGFSYEWTYIITENLNGDELATIDTIPKENFGMKVLLFNRKYAAEYANFFINKTYAYDCYGIYTNQDSVTDINVFTANRLNSSRPAMSNVSDLFCSDLMNNYQNACDSIPVLISLINTTDWEPVNDFNLYFRGNEVKDTIHRFIVKIELSDGRMLTDTTNAVNIR